MDDGLTRSQKYSRKLIAGSTWMTNGFLLAMANPNYRSRFPLNPRSDLMDSHILIPADTSHEIEEMIMEAVACDWTREHIADAVNNLVAL